MKNVKVSYIMPIPIKKEIIKRKQEVRESFSKNGYPLSKDWKIIIDVRPYLFFDIRYESNYTNKTISFIVYSVNYPNNWFEYLDDRYMEITDYHEPCPLMNATGVWILNNTTHTVVPFDILEVFSTMKDKYSTDEIIVKCVKALLRELP